MKQYKAYLIDLDGTIYNGDQRIPTAEKFVRQLISLEINFLFLTNNATRSPEQVAQSLKVKCELPIQPNQVYTSALALIAYLKQNHKGKRIFVVGEASLKQLIQAAGFTLDQSAKAQVVVQALDRHVTYQDLALASLAIRSGAAFVVTNIDANIPTAAGLFPSSGAITAFLSYATQQEPIVMGKPYAPILEGALERLRIAKEDVLMIGDNYTTDIQVGIQNGVDTLLVLTGVTKQADLGHLPILPTYILNDLSEWKFN